MAFPQDVLGTKVEIWYDGQWNEITSDVRGTGAEDGEIEIDPRGQPNESTNLSVTQATLSVNNRDGKYSPRNLVSPLYGKIGMNTPLRIITDISDTTNVEDDFSTNGTNGWPNADSGHPYTVLGTASDYLTNGGLAYHRHTAVNVEHRSSLDTVDVTDFDCVIEGIACEAAPTGDAVLAVLRGRMSGAGANYIQARIAFFSGSVFLNIDYSDGGVFTQSSGDTVDGVTSADTISVRFRAVGRDLYLRAWETGSAEPSTWNISFETPVIAPGQMTILTLCGASLSNALPFDVTFQGISFNLGIILFTGEISEWPKKWDKTGNDVWVPLVANGMTRRLMQGEKALRSPLYRHYQSFSDSLTGYWSFENIEGTAVNNPLIASDLDDGQPLRVLYPIPDHVASVKFSDESSLLGSDPLGTAYLGASDRDFNYDYIGYGAANFLGAPSTHDSFSLSFWNRVELRTDVPSPGLNSVAAVEMQNHSTIKYYIFTVQHGLTVDSPTITLFANGYTADLLSNPISCTVTVPLTAEWHHVLFAVQYSGGSAVLRIVVDGVYSAVDTEVTTSVGQPVRLDTYQLECLASEGIGISFGHLAVATGITEDPLLAAVADTVAIGLEAYAGETDVERLQRLFAEQGITLEVTESADDPGTKLGPQRTLKFMDLVHETARTGDGVLYEMREDFGYRYKSRWALYGSESALTLDYSNTDLAEVPETTDDDQRLRNQITVKREGGAGSVTVEQTTGPLSTNDPRATVPGAGLYDDEPSGINLYEDAQRADYAGWRLRLGTWDESRFPGVSVALHRTPFTGDRTKFAAAALMDVAEILTITNPPPWLPPDNIVLQMRSVKLYLSNFNWGIEWNCLPGRPWTDVATTTPEFGRADTVDSSLVSTVDSDDTELVVTTAETNLRWTEPQWTEDISELNILGAEGIDLRLNPQTLKGALGGERVRVAKTEAIRDGFTRSGQLSGSATETGQTWVNTFGTAANATTDGTKAVLAHPSSNSVLIQTVTGTSPDICLEVDLSFNFTTATGGSIFAAIVLRSVDLSNYYSVFLEKQTGSADPVLYIQKSVAGVQTNLIARRITNQSVFRFKIELRNRDILVKLWDPSTAVEGDWSYTLRGAASQILTGNDIAFRTTRVTANTNVNPAVNFDNLKVTTGAIRPYIYDRFDRTVSNGLGNTTTGETWTLWGSGGGSASDYQVAPNRVNVTVPNVNNAFRGAYLAGVNLRNACVSYTWQSPNHVSAQSYRPGLVTLRMQGTSTFILWTMTQTSAEVLTVQIINASGATLAGPTTIWANLPDAPVRMRTKVACYEDKIMGKVWPPDSPEPAYWQIVATDPDPIVSGHVGWLHSRDLASGVVPTITVEDFRIDNPQKMTVQRGMDGVSRSWDAGTDVRLWTPAQVGR